MSQEHCKRCGHHWIRRTVTKPATCPRCKSYAWDRAKLLKKGEGK